MESPQRMTSVLCPQCGALLKLGQTDCWLCHAPIPPESADAIVMAEEVQDGPAPPTGHLQFGISSLLLVTTLLAIICSIIRMAPGLGIFLAIVTVPALVRTCILAYRSVARGQRMSAGKKAGVFLLSMVMVSIVIVVSSAVSLFIAFVVICTPGGNVSGGPGGPGLGPDNVPLGLTLGGLAGLAVAALLIWCFCMISRSIRRR